jgi:uncharacterized protein (DUF1800 family)
VCSGVNVPIAAQFRASHYDIKVALRGLFMSDAFWSEDDRGVLVKISG